MTTRMTLVAASLIPASRALDIPTTCEKTLILPCSGRMPKHPETIGGSAQLQIAPASCGYCSPAVQLLQVSWQGSSLALVLEESFLGLLCVTHVCKGRDWVVVTRGFGLHHADSYQHIVPASHHERQHASVEMRILWLSFVEALGLNI